MALVLKSVISQNCLPGVLGSGSNVVTERGRAPAGTLYWCRDTKNAFLALSDGKLLDLSTVIGGRLEREVKLLEENERLKTELAVAEWSRNPQKQRDYLMLRYQDFLERVQKAQGKK